ncbi:MAG: Transcriptional regulator, IclR family, partial [Mycobacterium sp.]|nr:Transcriptional regulator, IclR family [Mycobacterium sp.]
DAGYVVHLPEDRRYALGVRSHDLGTGYARQAPLQRLARVPLATLVDRTGHSGHLAVLHGNEVVYVLEERATGRTPLITDVGVRLPAQLTASGRAMLAALPLAQVRALYPAREAFLLRTGSGPTSRRELAQLLKYTRDVGHASEDGEVTPGFASVASAVLDVSGYPIAAVALTFPAVEVAGAARTVLAGQVRRLAIELSHRLGRRGNDRV